MADSNTLLLYFSLFAVAFLAATVLPLGSEAALVGLVVLDQTLMLPLIVATTGNLLGSATTFWLGRKAGHIIEQREPTLAARTLRAQNLLQRWGTPILLLAWLPVLGDVLVGVAGALHAPWKSSLFWIGVGKAARYAVIGWLALAVQSS